MLRDVLVHPAVLKPGYLCERTARRASVRRALWLLALTVCKNTILPVTLSWKTTRRGERGRRRFDLEDEHSDVVAFGKKSLFGVENWKKQFIQNSYCLDKNYGSVFRYCGKCFLAFFSDFISSPLFLFLKNKHTQNKNRAKRREKEILLLMLCGKTPSPDCSAVRTWLATCIGASPVPSNSPLFLQGRTSKC